MKTHDLSMMFLHLLKIYYNYIQNKTQIFVLKKYLTYFTVCDFSSHPSNSSSSWFTSIHNIYINVLIVFASESKHAVNHKMEAMEVFYLLGSCHVVYDLIMLTKFGLNLNSFNILSVSSFYFLSFVTFYLTFLFCLFPASIT